MPEQRGVRAKRLSLAGLMALHLFPGALGTIAYILLAKPIASAGYPPLAALLVAVAVVILPLELAILYLARASGPGARRQPVAVRTWLWLVPALLAAAVAGSVALAPADAIVAQMVFGWLPGWYLRPIDFDSVTSYSASAWTVTLGAYLVLNGLAGPVVEELYFRGWLLPRMARFGRWAPLLNVVLFSVYHFWTPWQFLSRVVAVAPFAYAVWWRRNIRVGMAVHILLNTIGGVVVVTAIAGRL
jgi:membrane protease YdiL (CAAX protease family)